MSQSHKKIPRPSRFAGADEGDAEPVGAVASVTYYEKLRMHAPSMGGHVANIKRRDDVFHDVDA